MKGIIYAVREKEIELAKTIEGIDLLNDFIHVAHIYKELWKPSSFLEHNRLHLHTWLNKLQKREKKLCLIFNYQSWSKKGIRG